MPVVECVEKMPKFQLRIRVCHDYLMVAQVAIANEYKSRMIVRNFTHLTLAIPKENLKKTYVSHLK